jgi:hypothetical protein
LWWALRGQRLDGARTLIERGAHVNVPTREGRTPLMLAAELGSESVSALLIERGARLDSVDKDGKTALILAIVQRRDPVAASLLARGAAVGLRDAHGHDALMHAALVGAPAALIDALIDRGVALEARSRNGSTPLIFAARWGHTEAVRALVRRGARLDARDPRGWSALDHVVKTPVQEREERLRAREATFDLLIASGIDPRLAIDPATHELDFRDKLEALYAQHALGPFPPYRLGSALPTRASSSTPPAALDSPATVRVLARATGAGEENAKVASGALVGYRGWTSVPKVLARAVVREVALYGEQRATLVGDARGISDWSVADVLLLELMENGRLVDIAFAGSAQGLEVNGQPVRRIGTAAHKHKPGEVDLTEWLTPSGRELVVSALSSFRGGAVSEVYLRVNGAGARRVLDRAEVDSSGRGGTL